MLIQHSSATPEHYSPYWLVALARWILGGIDTDPCSCDIAQQIVGATNYYTKDNPLWTPGQDPEGTPHDLGSVFINPPGGVDGHRNSIPALWWGWLLHQNCRGAFFVGFNPSILATSQDSEQPLSSFIHCHLRRRVRFLTHGPNGWAEGKKPAHQSVVAYLGDAEGRARFRRAMHSYGHVVEPS